MSMSMRYECVCVFKFVFEAAKARPRCWWVRWWVSKQFKRIAPQFRRDSITLLERNIHTYVSVCVHPSVCESVCIGAYCRCGLDTRTNGQRECAAANGLLPHHTYSSYISTLIIINFSEEINKNSLNLKEMKTTATKP